MVVVDAKGLIAGRLSSKVAKMIINGESVTVVNAEDAVVVGTKTAVMIKYKRRVDAAVKSNPHYGPKYSRIPDRIMRRMIRNMLPTTKRAKERIIGRLMVHNKFPKELAKEKAVVFEEFLCNERHPFMTMKEIALDLGGTW